MPVTFEVGHQPITAVGTALRTDIEDSASEFSVRSWDSGAFQVAHCSRKKDFCTEWHFAGVNSLALSFCSRFPGLCVCDNLDLLSVCRRTFHRFTRTGTAQTECLHELRAQVSDNTCPCVHRAWYPRADTFATVLSSVPPSVTRAGRQCSVWLAIPLESCQRPGIVIRFSDLAQKNCVEKFVGKERGLLFEIDGLIGEFPQMFRLWECWSMVRKTFAPATQFTQLSAQRKWPSTSPLLSLWSWQFHVQGTCFPFGLQQEQHVDIGNAQEPVQLRRQLDPIPCIAGKNRCTVLRDMQFCPPKKEKFPQKRAGVSLSSRKVGKSKFLKRLLPSILLLKFWPTLTTPKSKLKVSFSVHRIGLNLPGMET